MPRVSCLISRSGASSGAVEAGACWPQAQSSDPAGCSQAPPSAGMSAAPPSRPSPPPKKAHRCKGCLVATCSRAPAYPGRAADFQASRRGRGRSATARQQCSRRRTSSLSACGLCNPARAGGNRSTGCARPSRRMDAPAPCHPLPRCAVFPLPTHPQTRLQLPIARPQPPPAASPPAQRNHPEGPNANTVRPHLVLADVASRLIRGRLLLFEPQGFGDHPFRRDRAGPAAIDEQGRVACRADARRLSRGPDVHPQQAGPQSLQRSMALTA